MELWRVVSAFHRPSNWGAHAGASRAAIAVYLGDRVELEKTARVLKGYLGDRSSYAEFRYRKDVSWQCDQTSPVGLNPAGCTKHGRSIDRVLPDDQRRAGGFRWPPPKENYVYGALLRSHCSGCDLAQGWIRYV